MTVVVGVVGDGAVWMGADTLRSTGWMGAAGVEPKIGRRAVKVKGGGHAELLVGACGDVRMAQRVRWRLKPPAYRPGQDLFEWALAFADRFQALLAENKGGRNRNDGSAEGQLLVAFQGRLFGIGGSYGVVERRGGWDSIGSGCEFALGALYATRGQRPERRVRVALRAAARYDLHVAAPFQIERLDTSPALVAVPSDGGPDEPAALATVSATA